MPGCVQGPRKAAKGRRKPAGLVLEEFQSSVENQLHKQETVFFKPHVNIHKTKTECTEELLCLTVNSVVFVIEFLEVQSMVLSECPWHLPLWEPACHRSLISSVTYLAFFLNRLIGTERFCFSNNHKRCR